MTDDSAPVQLSPNNVAFCGSTVWRGDESSLVGTDSTKEYATFVKDLLEAEEKRGTGMETRALAVVTSSGTLVTLMLALAALATRVLQFRVPDHALGLAGLATASFVVAGILAALVNATWPAWGPGPDCLRTELWDRWGKPTDDPQAKVTATRLALWKSAHKLTQRKAKLVFAAAISQVVGVFAVAAAVVVVLFAD
ncbi:hypothetical protein Val02_85580 [Virgisporangium aliadipatigenens]|uniref:Uncharacterized protein n=1 Tax=Virgisporangium aliadipatigenens TaxID=741659 RepID=A0A8J4DX29_9ACTN|nr:hypothetical protein [Virgisporangium aliadipatigenens]GIJ51672.1 hypothetical protein Val02_85580 [Virgisporangium aliadipatigenens]